MVAIKQISIPAVVLLSLAEHAAAAPLARRSDIAARDVISDSTEAIDLAVREPGLGKVVTAAKKLVTGNKGKTFDRTLATANAGMTVANTVKAQQGKRDFEDFEERDFEEELEERGLGKVVTAAKKLITGNKGKTFDRTLTTANTAMAVANTHKTQQGKRDFEDFEERDFDEELDERDFEEELDERDFEEELDERDFEEELDERDWDELEERGLGKVVTAAKKLITGNKGKTFDRTLTTANTAMAVANTHKTQQGKRDFEDVEERDFEDEGLHVRDLAEIDERDLEEFDLVVRELEERALLAKVLKPVVHATMAVKSAVKTVVGNKGKTFDRTLATANTAMNAANTKKTQEKKAARDVDYEQFDERDLEELDLALRGLEELEIDERDLAEVDERDMEQVELALRDLEERTGLGILGKVLKPVVHATKAVGKAIGVVKKNKGKTFDRVLSTANTAMNVANTKKAQEKKTKRDAADLTLEERTVLAKVLKPIIHATKAVTGNKGKTFDRTLATANTAMNVANTHKTQTKAKRDLYELILESRDLEYVNELSERDVDMLIRTLAGSEQESGAEAEAPAPKKHGKKAHKGKHTKKAGRTHKKGQ